MWPSVPSALAAAQVFNSLHMSRISGISNPHWDHRATQETSAGTVAAGTGEVARDRDRTVKAGSCQLPDKAGIGDFGGRWTPFEINCYCGIECS